MYLQKRLKTLKILLTNPHLMKQGLKRLFSNTFETYYLKKSPIPSISLEAFFKGHEAHIGFEEPKNGRVNLQELTILSLLASKLRPKTILEIGTFDGMTTLHLAKNSPEDCYIWTLDLPQDPPSSFHSSTDRQFIQDNSRSSRVFENTPYKKKINQLLGDSREISFPHPPSGIDFIFIDGGHSLDVVKNDTEKSLNVLSNEGCILWHDYSPHTEDVYNYLRNLFTTYPLYHIRGTSLVFYLKNSKYLEELLKAISYDDPKY